jgi:hypothetical protein
MKAPLIVAQHTKVITGDHGLKHDGDAIVIWLQLPSETASDGGLRASGIQPKCPVALPDPHWVALDRRIQQSQQSNKRQ